MAYDIQVAKQTEINNVMEEEEPYITSPEVEEEEIEEKEEKKEEVPEI